jgi:Fe-S cluster assembly ATP-binding protein
MDLLKIDRKFTSRAVNEGFSGGEKKRCEILQMAMLEPKFASWTRPIPASTSTPCASSPTASTSSAPVTSGFVLITHYQRLLNYIVPDFVHVMYDGRIVKSGDKDPSPSNSRPRAMTG